MTNQTVKWERQEPGWYTSDDIGGIVLERDGKWWFWPIDKFKPAGSFKSLAQAKREARA